MGDSPSASSFEKRASPATSQNCQKAQYVAAVYLQNEHLGEKVTRLSGIYFKVIGYVWDPSSQRLTLHLDFDLSAMLQQL